MDEPRAYHSKRSKSERERQISCINYIYGIQKDDTDEPIYSAAIEMQT